MPESFQTRILTAKSELEESLLLLGRRYEKAGLVAGGQEEGSDVPYCHPTELRGTSLTVGCWRRSEEAMIGRLGLVLSPDGESLLPCEDQKEFRPIIQGLRLRMRILAECTGFAVLPGLSMHSAKDAIGRLLAHTASAARSHGAEALLFVCNRAHALLYRSIGAVELAKVDVFERVGKEGVLLLKTLNDLEDVARHDLQLFDVDCVPAQANLTEFERMTFLKRIELMQQETRRKMSLAPLV